MTTPTDAKVSVRGSEVRVLRAGSGPALLYLDVVAPEAVAWLAVHELLAARCDVIVPVLPVGSFELDAPRTGRDLAILARDLVDALGLKTFALVGASLGGWVAAELALSCSHDVTRLSLVGALGLPPPTGVPDVFAVSAEDAAALLFARPDDVPAAGLGGVPVSEQVRCRLKLMARLGWKTYLHDPLLAGRLHRIATPTTIIWGADDRLLPPAHAGAFASEIAGSRTLTIAGAGHLAALERPAETAAAILGGA